MHITVAIVVVGFTVALIGYLWLGFCFMGYPHYCKKHGWCSCAICGDCEDEGYTIFEKKD
jgi:hypothetical protein